MAPIVNGLEAEFAGAVAVVRLDADDPANAGLLREYEVRGHPAFVMLDAPGRVVDRYFGPQTAETLRAAMQALQGN